MLKIMTTLVFAALLAGGVTAQAVHSPADGPAGANACLTGTAMVCNPSDCDPSCIPSDCDPRDCDRGPCKLSIRGVKNPSSAQEAATVAVLTPAEAARDCDPTQCGACDLKR